MTNLSAYIRTIVRTRLAVDLYFREDHEDDSQLEDEKEEENEVADSNLEGG